MAARSRLVVLAALTLLATVARAQEPQVDFHNASNTRVLVFIVEPTRWVMLGRLDAGARARFDIPGYRPCERGALVVAPSMVGAAGVDTSAPTRIAQGVRTTELYLELLVGGSWRFEDGVLTVERRATPASTSPPAGETRPSPACEGAEL